MTNLSDMPVPLAMNDNLHDWLDDRFLQSLLRRGQRPGLIHFQQGQAIQSRMTSMALGLPLAAALQQRFADSVSSEVAALPIVFVQPQLFNPEPLSDATAPLPVIPTTAPTDHPPSPVTAEMPLAEGVIQRVAGPANSSDDKTERPQHLPSGIKSGGVPQPPQKRMPGEAGALLSYPQPFPTSESRAVTTRQQPTWAGSATAPSITKLPVVTAVVQRATSLSKSESESENKPLREIPPVITPKTATYFKERPVPVLFSSPPSLGTEPGIVSPPLPQQNPFYGNETPPFPSPLTPISSWPRNRVVAATARDSVPVVHPRRVISGPERGSFSQGLPLARPVTAAAAEVVQRTPTSPLGHTSSDRSTVQAKRQEFAVAGESGIIQRTPVNSQPAAANNPDIEQMTAKMQRKLLRRLEIEAERRGVKPWT